VSRRARLVVFGVAAAGVAAALVLAMLGLPEFGSAVHPYGDRAVAVAVGPEQTSNVVSSINFDQRGVDTLGEEFILFGSVIGALVLLRPAPGEHDIGVRRAGPVLSSTRLAGYLLLPVSLLVGGYIVAYGAISPGGGFQGGVILATGWHLVYVAGRYAALRRLVPIGAVELADAVGAAAFVAIGLAGVVAASAFLVNFLPKGDLGSLLSAGTVPVLNASVGVEVASGVVLLLAAFLEQAVQIRRDNAQDRAPDGGAP
jgi:multicomponent Na+:H+ antiporter subunit B